ncbi:MAG: hypothetical protein NT038_07855 [Euryarchaeota archaeon]|nr:hypothetical protein [Euryarchaeota archaeon]
MNTLHQVKSKFTYSDYVKILKDDEESGKKQIDLGLKFAEEYNNKKTITFNCLDCECYITPLSIAKFERSQFSYFKLFDYYNSLKTCPQCHSTNIITHIYESKIPKKEDYDLLFNPKQIYAVDIGDDVGFQSACEHYESTMNDPYFIALRNKKTGQIIGKQIYKRGTLQYYKQTVKPKTNIIKDIGDILQLTGDCIAVFFTLTCDTKKYGSQTGAWLEAPKDVNRVLTWARKGATGKRKRVYHSPNKPQREFKNQRPKIEAYYMIYENTVSLYPTFHVLMIFNVKDLSPYPSARKYQLRAFNDEMTCVYRQGFTNITELRSKKFADISYAVNYTTKYVSKALNENHPKYDRNKSIGWMTTLKCTGKRLFSMSRKWKTWHDQLYKNSLDEHIYANSNDNCNNWELYCVRIGGFKNLSDFIEDCIAFRPPPGKIIFLYDSSKRKWVEDSKEVYS